MIREAQCHCGQVKATCEGEPNPVLMCNCRLCQRRTGAPFSIGAWFPAENVRIEGETKPFSRAGDSGAEAACNICPNCGTSIWWEGFPGKIAIAGGCFGDPDFPQPTISIYEQYRHPWVHLPDGAERFDAMPSLEWFQTMTATSTSLTAGNGPPA